MENAWHVFLYPVGFYVLLFMISIVWSVIDKIKLTKSEKQDLEKYLNETDV